MTALSPLTPAATPHMGQTFVAPHKYTFSEATRSNVTYYFNSAIQRTITLCKTPVDFSMYCIDKHPVITVITLLIIAVIAVFMATYYCTGIIIDYCRKNNTHSPDEPKEMTLLEQFQRNEQRLQKLEEKVEKQLLLVHGQKKSDIHNQIHLAYPQLGKWLENFTLPKSKITEAIAHLNILNNNPHKNSLLRYHAHDKIMSQLFFYIEKTGDVETAQKMINDLKIKEHTAAQYNTISEGSIHNVNPSKIKAEKIIGSLQSAFFTHSLAISNKTGITNAQLLSIITPKIAEWLTDMPYESIEKALYAILPHPATAQDTDLVDEEDKALIEAAQDSYDRTITLVSHLYSHFLSIEDE